MQQRNTGRYLSTHRWNTTHQQGACCGHWNWYRGPPVGIVSVHEPNWMIDPLLAGETTSQLGLVLGVGLGFAMLN